LATLYSESTPAILALIGINSDYTGSHDGSLHIISLARIDHPDKRSKYRLNNKQSINTITDPIWKYTTCEDENLDFSDRRRMSQFENVFDNTDTLDGPNSDYSPSKSGLDSLGPTPDRRHWTISRFGDADGLERHDRPSFDTPPH
jgi:hypothetical protein